jgi:hypothetical protein
MRQNGRMICKKELIGLNRTKESSMEQKFTQVKKTSINFPKQKCIGYICSKTRNCKTGSRWQGNKLGKKSLILRKTLTSKLDNTGNYKTISFINTERRIATRMAFCFI